MNQTDDEMTANGATYNNKMAVLSNNYKLLINARNAEIQVDKIIIYKFVAKLKHDNFTEHTIRVKVDTT
jgi:hypothetical protein